MKQSINFELSEQMKLYTIERNVLKHNIFQFIFLVYNITKYKVYLLPHNII